jgi:hypothetical protein
MRTAGAALGIFFHSCTGWKLSLRDNNPHLTRCYIVPVDKNMFDIILLNAVG